MQQIEIQECKMELVYLVNELEHAHQDLEMLYMISREVEVQTEDSFVLKENDITIFNSWEKHALRCRQGAIAFRLLIPYRLLGRLSTDEIIFFQCNSAIYASNNCDNLIHLMEKLVLKYLNLDMADLSELSSILFQIIHELFENYKVDQNKIGQYSKTYQGGKIDRILNYIHLHYFENLNLAELADYFNMSETYLSRYFKEKVGQNYMTYLNDVRVQNAVLDLSQTDKSITAIAMDNGFSTPSVFNRHFKSKFGKTPSEYRKETTNIRKHMKIAEEKIKEIQQQLSEKLELALNRNVKPKAIKVCAGQNEIKWKNKNKIINIGEATAVSDAGIQKQILQMKQELKISYVRIWNLFSDKFMIARDFDGNNFNFFYLDSVLDFFVKNNIMLFLDLGPRKRIILATSERELYSEDKSHQPDNARQWENLLRHFMLHLMRRYGKEILEKWIFEFPWNLEPYYQDGFDYIQAYRIGRNIVKSSVKDAKVAGLSPNIMVSEEQLQEAISVLKEEDIFPDIVTMRVFMDLEHQLMKDVVYKRENAFLYARRFVERVIKMIHNEHIECEFCISEWSNSISNRNMIQDSCARGTTIINFVSGMNMLVDMMGFWHGTDAVDVFYDTKKIVYGGGGILTKDGIKKPSFYAFQFLNQLGGDLLKIGNNYIITKDSTGMIVCLCYNQREYSYYYYIKNITEQKDLSKMFQSEEKVILEIDITDMKRDGVYLIKEEVVNNYNGSIQDEWKILGNQEELGNPEIQYLKNICIPRIYMKQFVCVEGELSFHIELEPHEMRLIHISPY